MSRSNQQVGRSNPNDPTKRHFPPVPLPKWSLMLGRKKLGTGRTRILRQWQPFFFFKPLPQVKLRGIPPLTVGSDSEAVTEAVWEVSLGSRELLNLSPFSWASNLSSATELQVEFFRSAGSVPCAHVGVTVLRMCSSLVVFFFFWGGGGWIHVGVGCGSGSLGR